MYLLIGMCQYIFSEESIANPIAIASPSISKYNIKMYAYQFSLKCNPIVLIFKSVECKEQRQAITLLDTLLLKTHKNAKNYSGVFMLKQQYAKTT